MRIFRGMAVAAIVTFAAAQPALASERTVSVSFSDLDITTEAGVSELDNRISSAARRACGANYTRTVGEQREIKACRNQAVALAEPARKEVIANAKNDRALAQLDILVAPRR